ALVAGVMRRWLAGFLLVVGFGLSACATVPADSPAASERHVTIATPDGSADALLFTPAMAKAPAVILWADLGGLRPAIAEVGRKLAGEGYVVLVPNAFHRSVALDGTSASTLDFATRNEQWRGTATDERIMADVKAYLAYLDALPQVDTSVKAGAVGYEIGSVHAFLTARVAPGRRTARGARRAQQRLRVPLRRGRSGMGGGEPPRPAGRADADRWRHAGRDGQGGAARGALSERQHPARPHRLPAARARPELRAFAAAPGADAAQERLLQVHDPADRAAPRRGRVAEAVPRAHGGDVWRRSDDLGQRRRQHSGQHVHVGPVRARFRFRVDRAAAARPVLQHRCEDPRTGRQGPGPRLRRCVR